jgi:hypothetical protein
MMHRGRQAAWCGCGMAAWQTPALRMGSNSQHGMAECQTAHRAQSAVKQQSVANVPVDPFIDHRHQLESLRTDRQTPSSAVLLAKGPASGQTHRQTDAQVDARSGNNRMDHRRAHNQMDARTKTQTGGRASGHIRSHLAQSVLEFHELFARGRAAVQVKPPVSELLVAAKRLKQAWERETTAVMHVSRPGNGRPQRLRTSAEMPVVLFGSLPQPPQRPSNRTRGVLVSICLSACLPGT